jgi:hypothetical protein
MNFELAAELYEHPALWSYNIDNSSVPHVTVFYAEQHSTVAIASRQLYAV